jgi:flagellar basal-body rod protein FlgB
MFLERLFNQTNAPELEQMVKFTEARHTLLADNIVNIDTPGYQAKDLSLGGFQEMLGERMDQRDSNAPGGTDFSDIMPKATDPNGGVLFHDGQKRSLEQLMSDFSKNALMHNTVIEMLRQQYTMLDMAITEKPE